MGNFFDKGFVQNIVVSLLFLFISFVLGSKSGPAVAGGKRWKATVVISWFMILSGLYIFGIYFPRDGFVNPYSGLGFCLFFSGIILRYIGKFFIWWNK